MEHFNRIILLLIACLLPSTIFAAPAVYPVKGVFGFESGSIQQKAPAFSKWVAIRGAESLEKEFDAEFRKAFGSLAADNITDTNKHEVLVASLHLVRASQYEVPKMGNYEVHMPITLSIVITNPSTGEAIYSFTKTSYAAALVPNPNADGRAQKILVDQTASNFRALLGTLIKETKAGYNPSKLEISVVDTWKGLYILNKGSKHGIAKDDSITDPDGNELTVRHVAEEYSVASSLLGKIDKSKKLFKYATASTSNQFNKPRVLTMHEGWHNNTLKDISFYFDSEVSKESAFTLLPVNEYFRNLLERLARDTYSGKFETTEQREMPDYLIKFSATAPRYYTIGEKGKFSLNIYEQYVLGELLDKQGRIIFSAVGSDRIEDKNVAGMVFGKKARLEVLLKNAVVNLAEQFSKSIKLSHFVMPVKNVDGKSIEIEDKSRELRIGHSVVVYRNIGKVSGISSDVTIPIWEANVVDVQGSITKLELLMPLAEKGTSVSTDDVVILDSMSASHTADQSTTSVTYCSGISQKLGSLEINDFSVISKGFGYLLPYTLYDQDEDYLQKIHDAAKFGGFRDSLKLGKVDTAGRCLLPVYKADQTKASCDKGTCELKLTLAAGYRLYKGKEKKGAAASQREITIEECLESSKPSVIQGELSKGLFDPMKSNIIKLQYK